MKVVPLFCLPLALAICLSASSEEAGRKYVFEDLGQPVRARGLRIQFVTRDAAGRYVGWTSLEAPGKLGILGFRVDTGEMVWLDLAKFGAAHIQMIKAADGDIYAYAGSPGRFLKYDVKEQRLIDLGVPATDARYWLGRAVGSDGMFYVGSYPATRLVRCDPRTGKIEDLGRMATDKKECYIIHPAVSDDDVVYSPVGLHHQELWAYDTKTRTKKQILSEKLMELHGSPKVWVGVDGQVYGRAGGSTFLCKPDGIELTKAKSARRKPRDNVADGKIVSRIDAGGKLVLVDVKTRKETFIQTDYDGIARKIYSVSCERDGKVYGGCISPANSFYYDTKSGELKDIGRLTGGRIQVYDTLSLPKGLFLSSYTGAHIGFYDPSQPIASGKNPQNIVAFSREYMQERPTQLVVGPDGMIYAGTVPVKGILGGALARINPEDFSYKVWRNIIPNQSILYLAAVPETGELFCTSSIRGGTSAISTEKEAYVFLWDTKSEKVVFRAHPIPGATYYGSVARARNGFIYGLAGGKYYAFDPKKRKAAFVGDLPVKRIRWPGLSDEPVGSKGLIYGVGDDAIFAIDPADNSVRIVARHESLKATHGFYVTRGGVLYYGSTSNLMRCKLGE